MDEAGWGMSVDHEDMAVRAVLWAPFCGPAPGSNRWPDLELEEFDGTPLNIDGEAIDLAIRRGWLKAEQLHEPGYVIQEDDGPLEFMWRYHPEPAMKSIFEARQMRKSAPPAGRIAAPLHLDPDA